MAELTSPTPTTSCCSAETQATCCEPSDKDACCGTAAPPAVAAAPPGGARRRHPRDGAREVRRRCPRRRATPASWCCEAGFDPADTGTQTFGAALYGDEGAHAPEPAVNASLGCGVPTAVADLHEGETVLDLGSGAGADVLISARRVGPTGKVDRPGHDRRDARARARQRRRGRRRPTSSSSRATSRTSRSPTTPSTSSSPTASSTSPPTSAPCSPRPRASCDPAAASPSPTSSPTPTWTTATRADMAAMDRAASPARSPKPSSAPRWPTPASTDIEIRPTHRVHEHATSAIVRASLGIPDRQSRTAPST